MEKYEVSPIVWHFGFFIALSEQPQIVILREVIILVSPLSVTLILEQGQLSDSFQQSFFVLQKKEPPSTGSQRLYFKGLYVQMCKSLA